MDKLPNTIEELGYMSADPLEKASFAAAKELESSMDVDQSGSTLSGLFVNSDGSINYEKSLDAAKTKTLELQKQAQQLTEQNKTNTSSFVSSSEPVVQEEKTITTEARSLLPTPPEDGATSAKSASDQYLALIDEQMKRLEQRRASETAVIEGQFAGAKQGLELEQKKEKGATSSTIARLGGYLGPSASAQGVMLNLAQTHRNEVSTLEAKKAEAIRQANNSIDDKQFTLARLQVEEVKDIEKTIHQRKVDFFNQSLDILNEERRADEYTRSKFKEDLATFGEMALTNEDFKLDPQKEAEFDNFFGIKGYAKQYIETIKTSAKAQTEKDRISAQKDMLDLLEKIPAGQELTFPDGTTYIGLGNAGDVYTSLQTDDSGIGRLITYDKRSGNVHVTPVGQVGKTKESSGGVGGDEEDIVIDNVNAKMAQALETTKDENGYYDPDVYLELRQELKVKFPGLLKQVDKTFLNPTNELFTTDAITRLRGKGVFADDRSTF